MRRNEEGRLEMYPMPITKISKAVIVGESPLFEEIQQGEFFVSTGADALRATLTKMGMDPKACHYTVAVPWLINRKHKELTPEQLVIQRARLIQEIKDSGAQVVMTLGTTAAGIVLNQPSITITKVLGNIMEIPELPGIKIIPNFHPAMLLHSPGNYKVFQNVIDTVAQYYKGQDRNPGVTQWSWIDTTDKLEWLIEQLRHRPFHSADIETSSLDTTQAVVWVLGIALQKNEVYVVPHELMYQERALMQLLYDSLSRWIWHNGKYDTSVLYWQEWDARTDEDTMLMHYCLNETNGTHGLGICSTVYLGAEEYKSKMNSEFAAITTYEEYLKRKEALAERVAVDADYTYQLYEIFSPEIGLDENHSKLYNTLLIPGTNFLRRVQIHGMKVDVPYLLERKGKLEAQIEEATQSIIEAATPYWDKARYLNESGAKSGSEVFKPTSVKQLQWMVYDRLKLKPKHKDAKKRGTGAEILEAIIDPPEFIIRILHLRKLKKKLSTYVNAYLECMDKDHIVHATFNLHITATGRLSCVDPNLQNVPSGEPESRNSFIPRGPGRVLIEVDYSGAELRVLAYVSGDKVLAKAVTEGDPHGELAEKIYGVNWTKADRGRCKTINFGIAYGRMAPSIAVDFGIPLEEAQHMIDMWAELYPDAWAYLQACENDVREGKALTTLWGRQRRFGLITGGNIGDLINEAKNFRIQSISSDNTLVAAMEAEEKLVQDWDAYIINLIHDSILIDAPYEHAPAIAEYMTSLMESVPARHYGCDVAFHSDVDIGVKWGALWGYDKHNSILSKEVIDADGTKHFKTKTMEEWWHEFGSQIAS